MTFFSLLSEEGGCSTCSLSILPSYIPSTGTKAVSCRAWIRADVSRWNSSFRETTRKITKNTQIILLVSRGGNDQKITKKVYRKPLDLLISPYHQRCVSNLFDVYRFTLWIGNVLFDLHRSPGQKYVQIDLQRSICALEWKIAVYFCELLLMVWAPVAPDVRGSRTSVLSVSRITFTELCTWCTCVNVIFTSDVTLQQSPTKFFRII